MSVAELAQWVDASAVRADGLLFTGTAHEDLDEIASWQRLADLAFAGQCRAIVAAHNRASSAEREFVPDEVGLAIGASPTTGACLTALALSAAALPGLLEAVEGGLLTERHLRAVLRELDLVELSAEQRAAVISVLLSRVGTQTPGELVALVRRLVLTVDRPAARAREAGATAGRRVRFGADVDGQAALYARGPVAQIAAVRACLETMLAGPADDGDDRTADARRFDLFVDLLTGGSSGPGRFEVQVLVPVSTATGGDLEPAEVPGFGPILPGTARDLLDTCDAVRRICVDAASGQVVTVDDAVACGPAADAGRHPYRMLDRVLTDPIVVRDLSSDRYAPSARLVRYLEARDRTCVFPGCGQTRTDKDHRIPWPRGSTSEANLGCLCRRHHRAKHTSFTVTLDVDGTYVWTTRGGQQHRRPPRTS